MSVERSLSFGSVAAAYERFRPGYPDALVEAVLAYAGGPVTNALEVGAGTGKATRVFAAQGMQVTATDPDPDMLEELRKHVPDSVQVVQSSFEELPLDTTYDLVFAGASFHWTQAEGRWPRVARLLVPGGVFASFGGQHHLADADLELRVQRARAPYLPDDEVASPDGTPDTASLRWPGTELRASELFTDVRQVELERRPTLTADDFVGHLSTVSAYLVLPEPDRIEVLRRIREVLPPTVELDSDLTLHLARTPT